jgi:hypothetical protein
VQDGKNPTLILNTEAQRMLMAHLNNHSEIDSDNVHIHYLIDIDPEQTQSQPTSILI